VELSNDGTTYDEAVRDQRRKKLAKKPGAAQISGPPVKPGPVAGSWQVDEGALRTLGRGKRYDNGMELRDAVRAAVGRVSRIDVDAHEPQAAALLNKLHKVVDELSRFAKARTERGQIGDFLVQWVTTLRGEPAGSEIPRHGLWPIPRLQPRAELADIVRYNDGAGHETTDRHLALIALELGYWPATIDMSKRPTVADAIKVVTKSVREIRRGLARKARKGQ
jgi:hypothetical protein